MKLTIHTLDECPWCDRAKSLAKVLDFEYEEIPQKHPDWPTVPYIVVGNKPIGGFTEFAAYCRKL
jgi:glutaredoxin